MALKLSTLPFPAWDNQPLLSWADDQTLWRQPGDPEVNWNL